MLRCAEFCFLAWEKLVPRFPRASRGVPTTMTHATTTIPTPALSRSARMGTTNIIRTPARHTAITGRPTLLMAYLSAPDRGTAATTEAAIPAPDTMAAMRRVTPSTTTATPEEHMVVGTVREITAGTMPGTTTATTG